MKTADNLVDTIYEMIDQELGHTDDTVLCQITRRVDDAHYDVYVMPDREKKITGIPNMTRFNFQPGDYCYVYKIDNNFINSFICYKLIPAGEDGTFASESTLTDSEIAALGMKEDKINKITLINQYSTDEQYPSAKSVYEALLSIRDIIQGRTTSYVVSAATQTAFQSTANTITVTGSVVDVNGVSIPVSSLRVGDNFYVLENDYPDRWVEVVTGNTATLHKIKMPTVSVTGMTLNGTSVVVDTIGTLTTSNGIASNGGNIKLSLSGVATIAPKSMSLSDQSQVKIYLDQNGTTKTTSINDLDYTKLRVVESSGEAAGLSSINTQDFLFVKSSS